ncbi:MAG: hypothetical protein ABR579_02635 [Actinomycetota bacterium]
MSSKNRSKKIRAARFVATAVVALVVAASGSIANAATAERTTDWTTKTHPVFMPNIANQWRSPGDDSSPFQPPAPPCPESGTLPSPFSNCGLPEFPAVGEPYPGNMAYWGGPVQANPKIYLVYWGWGIKGAFIEPCKSEKIVEGNARATLPCDPDGAGKLMADFVYQMGGTKWAGLQSQYYETVGGKQVNIKNPKNQLGGIWVDDSSHLDTTKYTPSALVQQEEGTGDNGSRIFSQIAAEAGRGAAHFHIAKNDLTDANIVVIQPQKFSDPAAADIGYCAWHDMTNKDVEGGVYNGVQPGIPFTNMPYALNNGTGCGQGFVNGAKGKLDGYTMILGHEIEEAVTDPGGEQILPDGTIMGAWYDPFDANENADKCAWVDAGPIPGQTQPGAAGNIKGNHGGSFAVQSLWDNEAANGAGWCSGAGSDFPG